MTTGKYMIILAAIAGLALFFAGVYALETSDKDNDDDNADLVKITLKIDSRLEVKCDGVKIYSDKAFYVSGDANLTIKIPKTGEYDMNYSDPSTGRSGSTGEFGRAGSTLETVILTFPDSGDITGSITFSAHS
ncbi:MAG: hypothetical protein LBP82_00740 [Candidatus Methanoplasma sp.]|nr:hypothetical protein [Candidatus Methanoplasma sp.]